MELLNFFSKKGGEEPARLPSGSFTVDRDGRILSSTVPQSFPRQHVEEIARQILLAFQNARKAQLAVTELQVRFSGFKITARELRGGALIFLAPQTHMTA